MPPSLPLFSSVSNQNNEDEIHLMDLEETQTGTEINDPTRYEQSGNPIPPIIMTEMDRILLEEVILNQNLRAVGF